MPSTHLLSQTTVNIGVITDFDRDEQFQAIRTILINEIQKTVGPSFQVSINEQNEVFIGNDPQKAQAGYQQILPTSDVIFALGSMSTYGLLQIDSFEKPVVALGVFSSEFQDIPITENGTSGVKNFTYIQNAIEIVESIKKFQHLAEFQELCIIVDKGTVGVFDLEKGRRNMARVSDSLGINVNVVLLDSVSQALDEIPISSEAVFVAIPYQLRREEVEELASGLIEKKLPSYSITQRHVNEGILFTWGNQNDFQQLLRRLGIVVDDIVRGESLADMPVRLNLSEDLFLNLTTARLIEFPARFETIFTANIVEDEDRLNPQVYSLEEVIEVALKENLDIKISYQDLAFSEVDVKQAVSNYLPDADIVGSLDQVDKNTANPNFFRAERTFTGVGTFSQILYSEQVIAGIKIQKYLLEAQEFTTRQQIIDIILDCYSAYLNILQGKINLAIQQENLSNNKTNLEMAKLRSSLGAADNSDVYRFEGEVATSQQSVIEAQTNLFALKWQLNNLLNNKLEDEFDIQDIDVQDEMFTQFENSQMAQLVSGPQDLAIIMDFLTQESLTQYPSKNQLLANYKAIERQETMNKRRYYAPTLSAGGQFNQTLYRGGTGSVPPPGVEFFNTTWSLNLTLSYPLFDGNRRKYDLDQTKIQKEQLDNQLLALDNQLSLLVRNNVLEVLRSRTNIQFSRVSSENQQKNFELIQSNYQNGRVTVTQLLDAQRVNLQAKLNYSVSVYNFLLAFLQLENSIGYYSQLATEEEKTAFDTRLREFINNTSNE